ncbi:hypothetical protein BDY21DRAFT_210826 [Lineolata rhizophorae]|uniref:Uncharacterized protein n=1 Tax=Lineolata rhizophorae TaxID=578093 RepID=A0A6A6P4H8_9PEZI|nr:hypothetical protein BDY21DRAFT_210826 [Lineolata rhizophorae]
MGPGECGPPPIGWNADAARATAERGRRRWYGVLGAGLQCGDVRVACGTCAACVHIVGSGERVSGGWVMGAECALRTPCALGRCTLRWICRSILANYPKSDRSLYFCSGQFLRQDLAHSTAPLLYFECSASELQEK